jgi:hypothetical protein
MKPDYKLVAKAKYIHANADLASEIWHEVYKRYYPAKQLDTLVETLQSADAIEEDIDNDVNYFLVVLGGKTIGYFAWKMENTALRRVAADYERVKRAFGPEEVDRVLEADRQREQTIKKRRQSRDRDAR